MGVRQHAASAAHPHRPWAGHPSASEHPACARGGSMQPARAPALRAEKGAEQLQTVEKHITVVISLSSATLL